MLDPKEYKDALDVQDACNLSGVVRSFSRVLDLIWKEANELSLGTAYVNRHPISVMYSSKIASLTGSEMPAEFSEAYRLCQERSVRAA